jgi:membrane associated rhomboid family serine protease
LGRGANARQMGEMAVVLLPVYDHNKLKRISFQYVTVSLIIVNVAVFFIFQSGVAGSNADMANDFIASWGFSPVHVSQAGWWRFGAANSHSPVALTLITYMFLHGSLVHLGGNMLFLWVFGDNVEDAMGHAKFLVFYLLCGVCGGLTHFFAMPSVNGQLIGASGAVAGVIAAYLMLHPNVRVWVLAFYRIPLPVSSWVVLGLWIATQIYSAMTFNTGNVAFWAHVGGIVAGALLVVVMKDPSVPLFDRSTGLEEPALKPKPKPVPEPEAEAKVEPAPVPERHEERRSVEQDWR